MEYEVRLARVQRGEHSVTIAKWVPDAVFPFKIHQADVPVVSRSDIHEAIARDQGYLAGKAEAEKGEDGRL